MWNIRLSLCMLKIYILFSMHRPSYVHEIRAQTLEALDCRFASSASSIHALVALAISNVCMLTSEHAAHVGKHTNDLIFIATMRDRCVLHTQRRSSRSRCLGRRILSLQ